MSHPAWVCGLKLPPRGWKKKVAQSHPAWVCGLKLKSNSLLDRALLSHPAWVCGLKLLHEGRKAGHGGHTLRGCVD